MITLRVDDAREPVSIICDIFYKGVEVAVGEAYVFFSLNPKILFLSTDLIFFLVQF